MTPFRLSSSLSLAVELFAAAPVAGRRALIAGDCPASIAYLAGVGTMRRVARHRMLDQLADRLAMQEWDVEWRLLSRRENSEAQELAVAGGSGHVG
eukprot:12602605-Alexandrium_andersonii.AAC.1